MSNGNKSHTMVTQVEINDDKTITISVGTNSFMPGESVEISGYVVQDHGAFANIVNEFKTITGRVGDTAGLTVTATPTAESDEFRKGHDVTVFVQAAKVWVTVLSEGQAESSGIPFNVAVPGTVWGKIKGVAGPETYSDAQEGNQSDSAAEYAGQAASDGSSSDPAS